MQAKVVGLLTVNKDDGKWFISWSTDLCHFLNCFLKILIIKVHGDSQKTFEKQLWSRNNMHIIHPSTLVMFPSFVLTKAMVKLLAYFTEFKS